MKKISSYSMICESHETTDQSISRTIEFYNKGAKLGENFILNLMGSITPEQAKKQCPETPEIYYFLNVFSLEYKKVGYDRVIVDQKDIKNRFEKYWKNENGGTYDKSIVEALSKFAHNEDSVWVDRKATYIDFCQNKFLFDKEEIDNLFHFPGFAFPSNSESTSETSVQFWRNIFSKVYGKGTKEDKSIKSYHHKMAVESWNEIKNMQQIEKFTKVTLVKLFCEHFIKKTNVTKDTFRIGYMGGYSTIHTMLLKYFDKDLNSIHEPKNFNPIKFIEQNIKSIEAKNYDLSPNENWDRLLDYFETKLNIKYYQKSESRDEFSQFMSLVHGRILSTRSNAINQSIRLLENNKIYNERTKQDDVGVNLLIDLSKKLAKNNGNPYYRIREKQVKPLVEFHNHWKTKNLEDALKDASSVYFDKFPFMLCRELASMNPQLQKEKGIDYLIDAFKFYEAALTLKTLKCYSYRNVDKDHPVYPWFGESKPYCKCVEFDDENKLTGIQFKLLDENNNFYNCLIKVRGKRVVNEVLRIFKGENRIYRKDKYHTGPAENYCLHYDGKNKNPQLTNQGVAFRLKQNGNWYPSGKPKFYLEVACKLNYEPYPQESEYFMGVDLGWKHPATYSIVDKNNNIIEKGHLTKTILSQAGKDVDLFYKDGRTAKKEEVDWANDLSNKYLEKPIVFASASVCRLYGRLCKVFMKTDKVDEMFDDIQELAFRISPVFLENSGRNFVYEKDNENMGGLSEARIDMIYNLSRVFSRFISKSTNNKSIELAQTIWERITKKMQNIKKERYKVTASIIMDKVMEYKQNGKNITLVMEDLDSKTTGSNLRLMNRKISSWYSSRIISQLKDACLSNSIRFMAVRSANTSHLDENDNFTPRLHRFNPGNKYLDNRIKQHYMKYLNKKDFTSSRDPNKKSNIDIMYKRVWDKIRKYYGLNAKSTYSDLKKVIGTFNSHVYAKDSDVLLPCFGGEFICSEKLGVINSDVMASINIARKGIWITNYPKNDKSKKKSA